MRWERHFYNWVLGENKSFHFNFPLILIIVEKQTKKVTETLKLFEMAKKNDLKKK
jgi:hypothetical protein